MKRLLKTVGLSTFALTLAFGAVSVAQDHPEDRDHHDHDQYVKHDDWKRGQRIRHEDWDRARKVDDYHAEHLRRPVRGYEWRRVDGQYVMANQDGTIYQVVQPPR